MAKSMEKNATVVLIGVVSSSFSPLQQRWLVIRVGMVLRGVIRGWVTSSSLLPLVLMKVNSSPSTLFVSSSTGFGDVGLLFGFSGNRGRVSLDMIENLKGEGSRCSK
ncbi:hypothetical protein TanjilG_31626 [Lupinus angustifolius]|uniref:Uncharacterized protein n=1 Tax=Lupinus angustifolius TaxID=3871 RepID=A0A394DMS8_LUPAN|nr:hypothetical protein TanjilG_31626 [Lupinus angustifolius]